MKENLKVSLLALVFFGALIGAFVGWWRSDSNVWLIVSIVLGGAVGAVAALIMPDRS